LNIVGVGHGRPNDSRGFIHKKILGLGGKIATTLGNLPGVNLIPGSGIVRTAGQIATTFAGTPGRPEIIGLPPSGLPFGPSRSNRLPESDPMKRPADTFGFGPARVIEGAMQQGNGACPPAVGNRRVNAAGQCAPPGFHWNVSSYTRLGGACSRFAAGFVERGTVLVKNRKMNNANGGAQDKALKRIERGQDHAKRILRATGWRTISKQSSREMRMRRRGHR